MHEIFIIFKLVLRDVNFSLLPCYFKRFESKLRSSFKVNHLNVEVSNTPSLSQGTGVCFTCFYDSSIKSAIKDNKLILLCVLLYFYFWPTLYAWTWAQFLSFFSVLCKNAHVVKLNPSPTNIFGLFGMSKTRKLRIIALWMTIRTTWTVAWFQTLFFFFLGEVLEIFYS